MILDNHQIAKINFIKRKKKGNYTAPLILTTFFEFLKKKKETQSNPRLIIVHHQPFKLTDQVLINTINGCRYNQGHSVYHLFKNKIK